MTLQMNIADWVAVFTSSITAITAVVMAVLAYRTYLKAPVQEAEPETAQTNKAVEPIMREQLVFETSKQQTKLKITEMGLECHLEDSRPDHGGHQWTISKEEARQILKTSNFFINPGYKANTGIFSIGTRRNWLYSKKLFPEPEYLHGTIKDLLKNTSAINI